MSLVAIDSARNRTISMTLPEAIEAGRSEPARRLVIDPIVAAEEISLLHSQPREGKTWFLLAAGLAVAVGGRFADRFPTSQTTVLYVSNEDGQRAVQHRLELLLREGDHTPPDTFRLAVGSCALLDYPAGQRSLIAEVKEFEVGLVILDPLRSLTMAVDKGPSDLQPFGLFLRRLINATGCAVWLSHHDTKPSAGVTDDRRRHAQRMSGGGLFSYVDAPIHIERIDETTSLFTADGFKHAETPAPFTVQRVILSDFAGLTIVDAPGADGAELELREEIRKFLAEHPDVSGSRLTIALKRRREHVWSTLEAMREDGILKFTPRGKAKLWALA